MFRGRQMIILFNDYGFTQSMTNVAIKIIRKG